MSPTPLKLDTSLLTDEEQVLVNDLKTHVWHAYGMDLATFLQLAAESGLVESVSESNITWN